MMVSIPLWAAFDYSTGATSSKWISLNTKYKLYRHTKPTRYTQGQYRQCTATTQPIPTSTTSNPIKSADILIFFPLCCVYGGHVSHAKPRVPDPAYHKSLGEVHGASQAQMHCGERNVHFIETEWKLILSVRFNVFAILYSKYRHQVIFIV